MRMTIYRFSMFVIMGALLVPGAYAQRSLLKQFEAEFVSLSEEISPSVVEISTTSSRHPQSSSRLDEMFKFFGLPRPDGEAPEEAPDLPRRPSATGTGFFIDEAGHIVTNNHVVEGADSITVKLSNGDEVPAELIGQDPGADIAVIKIEPNGTDIRPVSLGDSSNLKVGQFAIAIGSARGQTGSVSYGHISGLGREGLALPDPELRFQEFIQTDAAINLGNSGGPLCNIDGEVIGVNVAIVYDANSIGFAIPINRVKKIVPQLINDGSVTRGWLGVSIRDLEVAALNDEVDLEDFIDANGLSSEDGAYVVGVATDGPSDVAGLLEDDVVLRVNDHDIEDTTDLINYVSDLNPGTAGTIDVMRKGEIVQLDITIGKFPGLLTAKFGRDYFGMHMTDAVFTDEILEEYELEEALSDFVVVEVVQDSPAAEAGVRPQDIILEVAHQEVKTLKEFRATLAEKARAGKTLLMRVRQLPGETRKVYIKVPEDYEAPE
ncbi:MAG: trypsin-like peptidase domain-containing protein [Candidatus Hydrogenedentota bacterium]